MTTPVAARPLSCDEFDALPEPGDGRKMELDDGEVVYSTVVNGEHGQLAGEVYLHLRLFAQAHRLGRVFVETGFRLRDVPRRGRVRGPDVSFVAAEHMPPAEERRRGSFHIAPDLAVEVKSPGDGEPTIATKVAQYLEAGTARVWVVRPAERTVTIYRPETGPVVRQLGSVLTSGDAGFAAPGFELALDDLFAVLD